MRTDDHPDARVSGPDDATFETRLADVRRRIAAACARAGRRPESVKLVAVTKGFGPGAIDLAARAGLHMIGESRVQEALWKAELCSAAVAWHLIGHLQRNKAHAALAQFEVLHSVDSMRLIDTLERVAQAEGHRPLVMLEINVSGEASKFGLDPDDAPAAIERLLSGRVLSLGGLMSVPPFSTDPERARPYFARLRALRDTWAARFSADLPELSIGMSNDFEVAIEEGATWIRLGSALFGPRPTAAALRRCMAADDPATACEMD